MRRIIGAFIVLAMSSSLAFAGYQLVNENNQLVKIDPATRSLTSVDYSHSEIHSGNHYVCSITDLDLDTAETNGFVIVVPDSTKWAHVLFNGDCTASADLLLYEGTVHGADGTELTCFNSNRNSTNLTNLACYQIADTTITNLGTKLPDYLIGSNSPQTRSGGQVRGDNEFILKQNTSYSFFIVGQADNGRANISLTYYLHTSKTD